MRDQAWSDPERQSAEMKHPLKDNALIADFIAPLRAATPLFDAVLPVTNRRGAKAGRRRTGALIATLAAIRATAMPGGNPQIIEMRTYVVLPERLARWLRLWESNRAACSRKSWVASSACTSRISGRSTRRCNLWRFESLAERERRRGLPGG